MHHIFNSQIALCLFAMAFAQFPSNAHSQNSSQCPDLLLTRIEHPEDPGTFSEASSGIFRTLSPTVSILAFPPESAAGLQIFVDDGDDLTLDALDITSLLPFDANGQAHEIIPEFVPINSLPGPNQDTFRTLLDNAANIRLMYFGENRIRIHSGGGALCYEAHFLCYDSFSETVVGVDDGNEGYPGDTSVQIMKYHIMVDFDSNTPDKLISYFLLENGLRPQGITRDLGVVQARPIEPLTGPDLLAKISLVNAIGSGFPGFEEAGVDILEDNASIGGELYPEAIKNDFQPQTADWIATVRQNHYHHFILQTFPAHRLIDNIKANFTPEPNVRIFFPDSGIGTGGQTNDFSAMPEAGNKFFVKGRRLKQPVRIFARKPNSKRDGRTVMTNPWPDTGSKPDGDLRHIMDVHPPSHGSKILGMMGGDGVGDRSGVNLTGDNIVLGTGKDAEVRVVKAGHSTLELYKYLEISNPDSHSKIFSRSRSYNKAGFNKLTNSYRNKFLHRFEGAITGKIAILSAGNDNDDVSLTEKVLISPTRNGTNNRSANTGGDLFKQRVLVVGATDRISTANTTESKRGSSNKGSRIGVVAPGELIRGTDKLGNLTNASGTSYAAPIVSGIAAELMLVDPTLQQEPNLPKVLEYIEATADDLGAPGWDEDTGFGRVNFWKSVLAAANGGLSAEGRTADNTGKDNFFTFLPLKDEAATSWYGFEVRVPTKNAVLWFRKMNGLFEKVQDPDAKRPMLQGIGEEVVTAFMSTQGFKNSDGKILPSLPFSPNELAGLEKWYLARFSIQKDMLADKTHLLAVKPGETPSTTNEGGNIVLSLPLDNFAELRKGKNSSIQTIKDRVEAFDDFVLHVRSAQTVGIAEPGIEHDIRLYPNPATGEVFLVTDFEQAQPMGITICDFMGKTLLNLPSRITYAELQKFDIAAFGSGTYFVKIQLDKQTVTKKLVVLE